MFICYKEKRDEINAPFPIYYRVNSKAIMGFVKSENLFLFICFFFFLRKSNQELIFVIYMGAGRRVQGDALAPP